MSQEVQSNRSGLLIVAMYVVAPGLFLIGLVVFLLVGSPKTLVGPPNTNPRGRQENHLAAVRSALAKQTDLAACKAIVAQLNSHLQRAKEHAPAPLSPEKRKALAAQWVLSPSDLDEVGSPIFTALDAHHLETSFLLRDAARGVELATPGGQGRRVKQTPLEQAQLAFAWVMRQVRLPQFATTAASNARNQELLPLGFVLRRGWGTPRQRALVFLGLLEQIGLDSDDSARLQGALLFCPDEKGRRRLWACGVAMGDKPEALYLFDPRMGLPIPGPDGTGVATLAQACDDKKKVLDQLQVDNLHYDVTPEQARQADVFLFCTLSALAPRMVLLQDHLLRDPTWNDQPLPTQVRVRLAVDVPSALSALRAAVTKTSVSPEKVREWPDGAGILRQFLSKDEGGSDAARALREQSERALVPWADFQKLIEQQPRYFLPEEASSLHLDRWFQDVFLRPFRDPNSARELLLRGRFTLAPQELAQERLMWSDMRERRKTAPDLHVPVRAWIERATTALAEALRARGTPEEAAVTARLAEVSKWNPNDPMAILMYGAAAEGRGAEVTYQLALCKHEQAARLQAQRELAARGKVEKPVDGRESVAAWKNAEDIWKLFMEDHAGRLGTNAVGLRLAECQAMRGDRQEAIRSLKNTPAATTDMEKLARLLLARQLEKQKN